MNNVLVIGSINMDLVVSADRFPAPGETVLGQAFRTFPGGKGANQAVAAARLGAQVSMIGCVGDDAFGVELINKLKQEGVETLYVQTVSGVSTGVALITLSQAENSIVVVPGANHAMSPACVSVAEEAFLAADVVLCQLEIPLPVVEAAAGLAALHGKPFLLNPAPATALPKVLLAGATLLTPNEHELSLVFESEESDWQSTLVQHPQRILMTRGADGAWFADAAAQLLHQPGFTVDAVDTTGAGDTFNGALAAFWGMEMPMLVRMACAASALSVTRQGAQSGMPTLAQLEAFLGTQDHQDKISKGATTAA